MVRCYLVCCYFPLVWYEPTCVDKAVKPIEVDCLSKIAYSSPNLIELRSMYSALTGEPASLKLSSGKLQ